MELTKEKQNKVFDALKESFNYKNSMQVPTIEKIVLNSGTGSAMKRDKKRNELVNDRLAKITGQKASTKKAKMSVAGFKVREGDPIAQIVTLRGARAVTFFDKLIHIALPRTKDFRGIDKRSVDEMGNLTLGIKEHVIFPETSDEEISNIFGMSITIVTTAKTKDESIAYLEFLGVPFKK